MSIVMVPAVRRQADHLFFVGMAIAIAATVVVGFTWSFLRTDIAKQLQSTWVKAHAVAFAAWILLYLCQAILVARRRIDAHRRLGVAGSVLAGLMIALALGSAIAGFRASPPRPAIEYFMLYVVVHVDIIMFATLVTAGVLLRDRPDTHKRLMLLATISLLDAVVPRLPLLGPISGNAHYVVLDMFVVCAILYDLISSGRVNPAYIWGGLVIFISPPGANLIFAATVHHLVGAGLSVLRTLI